MKNILVSRIALIIAIASTMFLSSCGDKAVEPQKPVTNEPNVPPVVVAPKEKSTLSVTVEGRTITFHSDSIRVVWYTNNSYRSLPENISWGSTQGASAMSVRATSADGWKLDVCVPRMEYVNVPFTNATDFANVLVELRGNEVNGAGNAIQNYLNTNSKPQRVKATFAKIVPADQKAEVVFSGSVERRYIGQPASMVSFTGTGVFNNVASKTSIFE